MTPRAERLKRLKEFYSLLGELEERLGGVRQLSECDGRMKWPKRGVYFFMESGERRTGSGQGPRIVRVGTHALKEGAKSKLWGRLSQHRGTKKGGGNQRGSIFRRLVGNALINKNELDYPSWDKGSTASPKVRERERELEEEVSQVIGEMPFLWLAVEDEPGPGSLRGYIERNTIALLSNWCEVSSWCDEESIDLPSDSWLGDACDRDEVRASGLWNSRHVKECYNPAFLKTLKRLVHKMSKSE